jgi:hypothetical protein
LPAQNILFFISQCGWIRINLFSSRGIPDRLLASNANPAAAAILFGFAAVFLAIWLWLTVEEARDKGQLSLDADTMQKVEGSMRELKVGKV